MKFQVQLFNSAKRFLNTSVTSSDSPIFDFLFAFDNFLGSASKTGLGGKIKPPTDNG